MPTTERGKFFRSWLVRAFRPKPINDHDPVPPDAKERIKAFHARLAEESERRGGNTFSAWDQQNRMWEIETLEEVIVETKYRSFILTRSVHDIRDGRLRRTGSGIKTLESFFINPWQVSHLDFSAPHFKLAPLSSAKTLDAAEKTITSLFPVGAAVREVPTQLSEMPKITSD